MHLRKILLLFLSLMLIITTIPTIKADNELQERMDRFYSLGNKVQYAWGYQQPTVWNILKDDTEELQYTNCSDFVADFYSYYGIEIPYYTGDITRLDSVYRVWEQSWHEQIEGGTWYNNLISNLQVGDIINVRRADETGHAMLVYSIGTDVILLHSTEKGDLDLINGTLYKDDLYNLFIQCFTDLEGNKRSLCVNVVRPLSLGEEPTTEPTTTPTTEAPIQETTTQETTVIETTIIEETTEQETTVTETTAIEYTFSEVFKKVRTISGVWVRNSPHKDADGIRIIEGGNIVDVIAVCNETGWYKIGEEEYITNLYVEDYVEPAPTETLPPETTPAPTTEQHTTEQTITSQAPTTITETTQETTTQPPTTEQTTTQTTEQITEPVTSEEITTTILETTTQEVTTETIIEYKPEYTYSNFKDIMITVSNSNVRNLPDLSGDIIFTIPMGIEIDITGKCNETGWYRIRIDGNEYYISNTCIAEIEDDIEQNLIVRGKPLIISNKTIDNMVKDMRLKVEMEKIDKYLRQIIMIIQYNLINNFMHYFNLKK